MRFQQKIVLITGASRGIGKAIAEAFAAEGAIVIGTATSETGATTISQNLGLGQGMVLDVTNPVQCLQVFSAIETNYGSPEILINNAGITRDNLFLRMKEQEWSQVIDTHLNGLYHLCKLAVKPMLKARQGRIINIGSASGSMGNPGQVNYAAAKAGMIGFSKALALEIASRNITVNVVAPGLIDTNMIAELTAEQRQKLVDQIPAGRVGAPADVAQAVLFLASSQASYITGQTLHVNGGLYLG